MTLDNSLAKVYQDKLVNNKEIYLKVKVIPKASITAFRGELADGTLKIAVAAPPEKNLANQQLLKFLGKFLEVDWHCLTIVSGRSARHKLIKITV